MISFKGAHFAKDIILVGVRWYIAYPLSYRHVEELMEEREVPVDHATAQRWVVKYSPQLEEAFHRRKRAVWIIWRMDETYIKIKGAWYYLYRAVDKQGQTIDFLLTEHRDEQRVGDDTFAPAVAQFGYQTVVELVGVAGFYSMVALTLNAFAAPPARGAFTPR